MVPTTSLLRFAGCFGLCAVLASRTPAAGPPFVDFETPQGEPIAVSSDGSRIYAVNTPDNRLTVFDAASLRRTAEIPVGLEPSSVRERPGTDEVWVVNNLSDSV